MNVSRQVITLDQFKALFDDDMSNFMAGGTVERPTKVFTYDVYPSHFAEDGHLSNVETVAVTIIFRGSVSLGEKQTRIPQTLFVSPNIDDVNSAITSLFRNYVNTQGDTFHYFIPKAVRHRYKIPEEIGSINQYKTWFNSYSTLEELISESAQHETSIEKMTSRGNDCTVS